MNEESRASASVHVPLRPEKASLVQTVMSLPLDYYAVGPSSYRYCKEKDKKRLTDTTSSIRQYDLCLRYGTAVAQPNLT